MTDPHRDARTPDPWQDVKPERYVIRQGSACGGFDYYDVAKVDAARAADQSELTRLRGKLAAIPDGCPECGWNDQHSPQCSRYGTLAPSSSAENAELITQLRADLAALTQERDEFRQQFDAFIEGQEASIKGAPRESNPYPPGDTCGVGPLWSQWDDGYDCNINRQLKADLAASQQETATYRQAFVDMQAENASLRRLHLDAEADVDRLTAASTALREHLQTTEENLTRVEPLEAGDDGQDLPRRKNGE